MRPDFWRAPTDNDVGSGLGGPWKDFGSRLVAESLSIEAGTTEVVVRAELRAAGFDARAALEYRVFATGEVGIDLELLRGSLPEIPRVGIGGALPGEMDRIEWFGPGPQETYADRKLLPTGRYRGAVADQYARYDTRGQESGNKADARYAAITDGSGAGLLVVGSPLLSVNVLPYSTAALEAAAHAHEIVADGGTHVHFDLAQRGVGGNNSWGLPPEPAYRLEAPAYGFRFWMQPLQPGDDPASLSRRGLP